MSLIKIQIRKTEIEWTRIEEIVSERYAGKNIYFQYSGLSHFLRTEINKAFLHIDIENCIDEKSKQIKKGFEINVPDSTVKKIKCLSNRLGVTPGVLISRMILNPHLLDK